MQWSAQWTAAGTSACTGDRCAPSCSKRIRVGRLIRLSLLALGLASTSLSASADESPGEGFFVLGPQDVGFSIGYGRGTSVSSSGRFEGKNVSELVVALHWQIELTRRPPEPAWYDGVVSFRIEPTLLANFRPRNGVAGGVAGMLRYQLVRWSPVIPYFEGGAGIIGLSFDVIDQADGLAFTPTAGAGVVYLLDERLSLQAAVRFQHISNAYTRQPNGGIETFQFLLGTAYHF